MRWHKAGRQLGRQGMGLTVLVAVATMLSACGGGGSGGTSADSSPTANPSTIDGHGAEGLRAYWSWTTEQRQVVGVTGILIPVPVFIYHHLVLADTGWAYVGPPLPDLADMRCTGPRQVDGQDVCVAWQQQGSTVNVSGWATPLTAQGANWAQGEQLWQPLPDFTGQTLSGRYDSYDCAAASCDHETFTFTADGHFHFEGFSSQALDTPGAQLGSGGGVSLDGRYSVAGRAITLTVDGRSPVRLFFFRQPGGQPDVLQIDDVLYSGVAP